MWSSNFKPCYSPGEEGDRCHSSNNGGAASKNAISLTGNNNSPLCRQLKSRNSPPSASTQSHSVCMQQLPVKPHSSPAKAAAVAAAAAAPQQQQAHPGRLSCAPSISPSLPLLSPRSATSSSTISTSNVTATGSICLPIERRRALAAAAAAAAATVEPEDSVPPPHPPLSGTFTARTLKRRLSRPLSYLSFAMAPIQSLSRQIAGIAVDDSAAPTTATPESSSPVPGTVPLKKFPTEQPASPVDSDHASGTRCRLHHSLPADSQDIQSRQPQPRQLSLCVQRQQQQQSGFHTASNAESHFTRDGRNGNNDEGNCRSSIVQPQPPHHPQKSAVTAHAPPASAAAAAHAHEGKVWVIGPTGEMYLDTARGCAESSVHMHQAASNAQNSLPQPGASRSTGKRASVSATAGGTSASAHSQVLAPNHPIFISMSKRSSVFYRLPKTVASNTDSWWPEAQSNKRHSQIAMSPDACKSHAMNPVGGDELCDGEDNSDGEASYDSGDEGDASDCDLELPEPQEIDPVVYCRELPYWGCYYTPDTHEFIITSAPHDSVHPNTEREPPMVFNIESDQFYPPTPETVDSIVEYLKLIYKIDTCQAVIPFERRLPELHDFIWNLMDSTMADMWTAIPCLILLRRYYQIQNQCIDASYEAAHSLFLGTFMLASITSVKTNTPEVFSTANIARIIDSHYTPEDLVRIRRETFEKLNYQAWISVDDIMSHAKNNLFDVYGLSTAYEHFQRRKELRKIMEEQERKRELRRKNLVAKLERFMYRTPHDSLGSWNTKTVYSIESRFLFRHLPWFPGVVTPMYVTARSEQAKNYEWEGRKIIKINGSVLPILRGRIAGPTV
ncbi:hypothetical protein GQ54DRAFT_298324 [Martensiomyces pterosporus]|nr:hypothetical protein GQ54DRAFT_298324 [Martensiomyces pterosporus]